jgi:hypothetical protein
MVLDLFLGRQEALLCFLPTSLSPPPCPPSLFPYLTDYLPLSLTRHARPGLDWRSLDRSWDRVTVV